MANTEFQQWLESAMHDAFPHELAAARLATIAQYSWAIDWDSLCSVLHETHPYELANAIITALDARR